MKNTFRVISFLEGLSFILLLFIATPIKYLAENDSYVKMLGMPHGLLFLIYIVFAFMLKSELKWSAKVFFTVLFASIIPFGTFYIDRKYLSN
ncbi:MAG: DUF3817 domain-containing protein [Lutibacter sp.]|uniref:DUF3817 domain-containing protein n=1 Tax=Lutibacter sp. TaxID=1925666 RepID=UPI0019F8295E|nr:DUF3817 domain-containing protein [Lutibacter sp.]NOR29040.1 DUF3817 domain-containing protein [Lutibacter sp.]